MTPPGDADGWAFESEPEDFTLRIDGPQAVDMKDVVISGRHESPQSHHPTEVRSEFAGTWNVEVQGTNNVTVEIPRSEGAQQPQEFNWGAVFRKQANAGELMPDSFTATDVDLVVRPMVALLAPPNTNYQVDVRGPEGADITYEWSLSGGACGVFSSQGNTASWFHEHGEETGCEKQLSHPGTVSVEVSDGVTSETRTYEGTLSGTGPR